MQTASASRTVPLDGRPTPGKHIYDTTGLLTSDEIVTLEQHALVVEQAGAPCVVYLQAKDATQDQTYQDAGDLMNRWDIESQAGARDGFVMFFNLQPGNLRHGKVVLFAGQKWYNSSLPQSETQRIYSDVMLSSLESGDTAQAIADGLDAVAHDLRYGPPSQSAPLTPVQQAFQTFGRVPFNMLAALYLVALIFVAQRSLRNEPKHGTAPLISTPPGDLAPAMVGTLLHGKVDDAQMEGTILDFARRGLLTIESPDSKGMRMQLHSDDPKLTGYEETVWDGLLSATNREDVIEQERIPDIRRNWCHAKEQLRTDLVRRGWLASSPNPIRTPLYAVGTVGIVGACLAGIVSLIAQEGWAMLGALVLIFGAVAAFAVAHSISNTTAAGEAIVTPWRGYASTLQSGSERLSHHELDLALPYAVAMGFRSEIGRYLEGPEQVEAYSPQWFRGYGGAGAGFYLFWVMWHSAIYPPPTSTGHGYGGFTGGFGGGGAAGGGGGGGGGF
jgi:uncharacterized protein (TIGR04222 family)